MKIFTAIFINLVLTTVQGEARGLTSYSDEGLCAQSKETIAIYLDKYIENFKSCFALTQKKLKNTPEFKELTNKANEMRLSISGELYNCGYYCDNPTPCMDTTSIMQTKPEGGDDAIVCWGTAW